MRSDLGGLGFLMFWFVWEGEGERGGMLIVEELGCKWVLDDDGG